MKKEGNERYFDKSLLFLCLAAINNFNKYVCGRLADVAPWLSIYL